MKMTITSACVTACNFSYCETNIISFLVKLPASYDFQLPARIYCLDLNNCIKINVQPCLQRWGARRRELGEERSKELFAYNADICQIHFAHCKLLSFFLNICVCQSEIYMEKATLQLMSVAKTIVERLHM